MVSRIISWMEVIALYMVSRIISWMEVIALYMVSRIISWMEVIALYMVDLCFDFVLSPVVVQSKLVDVYHMCLYSNCYTLK